MCAAIVARDGISQWAIKEVTLYTETDVVRTLVETTFAEYMTNGL